MNGFNSPPKLEGYVYSLEDAKKARDRGEILSIRLETSRICNLRCQYCCNKSGKKMKNEISYQKLSNLVGEAKKLGAKSVIVIGGGEPTIYPQFKQLIKKIKRNKMIPVIFTNTQTITLPLAKFLYRNNVSVIIKLDSLIEKTQDEIVGVSGAYKKIRSGLDNLLEVGYNKPSSQTGDLKLGASFVVNKTNFKEIPSIWKFCRDRRIFPNLEMMIPNGKGKNIQKQILSAREWAKLKKNLLKIDRKEYNFDWLPYTPLVGAGCFQTLYNLYITVEGEVRPCSSIHCHQANVKNFSLKEIINLPFFQIARNVDKHLKGNCKDCVHNSECIGCRGLAFSTNINKGKSEFVSICAEDPSCFMKKK